SPLFTYTATTVSYTLSLHDALPIFGEHRLADEERRVDLLQALRDPAVVLFRPVEKGHQWSRINDGCGHRGRSLRDAWDSTRDRKDRKSTRLNSSHLGISYAVFCLKK